LRNAGLKSVEDVAAGTDAVITRVPLPGMRDIVANAKRFLEAKDRAAVADHMAKKDAELAELREQLEEMRQIVLATTKEPELEADGSERVKRGPGRPRKEPTPQEAA